MLLREKTLRTLKSVSTLVLFPALLVAAGTAMAASTSDGQRLTQRLVDAIRANDMTAVEASLAAGADPEAADRWGIRPVDLAVDKGYYRIAHVLAAARYLKQKASPEPSAVTEPVAASAQEPQAAAIAAVKSGRKAVAATPASADAVSRPAAVQAAAAPWPAGVPNPFDPTRPPPRSELTIVGG
jgi:hypothetical protein